MVFHVYDTGLVLIFYKQLLADSVIQLLYEGFKNMLIIILGIFLPITS